MPFKYVREGDEIPESDLGGPASSLSAVPAGGLGLQDRSKSGGGSVTDKIDRVEFREPGNASGGEAAVLDRKRYVDPTDPGSVRFHLENVTLDADDFARILVAFGDGWSSAIDQAPDNDGVVGRVGGTGTLRANTISGGDASSTQGGFKSNGWVNGLEWVELSWDGSSVTMKGNNGSSEASVSHSSDYPSVELAVARIAAIDSSGVSAVNCDFDVTRVEVR